MRKGKLVQSMTLSFMAMLLACAFVLPASAKEVVDVKSKLVGTTYEEYLSSLPSQDKGRGEVVIQAADYLKDNTDAAVKIEKDYEGSSGKSLYMPEEGITTWSFKVPKTGLYSIEIEYYPVKGKASSIERNIFIDGKIPYKECRGVTFTRVWKHESNDFKRDNKDNDIRPKQLESPEWRNSYISDSSGYHSGALEFYLKAGEQHTISMEAVREPFLIKTITAKVVDPLPTYAEVLEGYKSAGYKAADTEVKIIQAEKPESKSEMVIYPLNDRTSAISEPQDVSRIRLNTIGKDKWKLAGQWVRWTIDIEEDGLYYIVPRARQNVSNGLFSSRSIKIDGKYPFVEAQNIRFSFNNDFSTDPLGRDGTPFEFYLTKGSHVFEMEVVLGDMSEIIRLVDECLFDLNAAYRQILMITGSTPDVNRDYDFRHLIPATLELLEKQGKKIAEISTMLEEIVGEKGEQQVILDKIAFQCERMSARPDDIAGTLSSFKSNVGSLGTWILTAKEQPLELDYFAFVPVGAKIPRATANIWQNLGFEFGSFFASFFNDYNSVGSTIENSEDMKKITVWIVSGRDQATIIRQMIDDNFTPVKNISVNFQLVIAGQLLPSTLAGTGPDVSLAMVQGDPVNYAVRSAVIDLTQFPDFKDIAKRFSPSALVPFEFGGKVYALPENQTWPMLFYRKDIMAELGLEVPKTWDDFYSIIPDLQKKNLEIGFPAGYPGMLVFLYQNGGSLYREDGRYTNLDSDEALEAFKSMSDMFTTYKIPRAYDFANRFRTGEMPIAVADYTAYNQLTVFAPEIKGLWEFVPLPGTLQEDGTINNTSPGTSTAACMMRTVKDKETAWEFMKWWTDAETQSRYSIELEATMGTAAKNPTANMEALKSLPWPTADFKHIAEQWKHVAGTPEVPGGYYTARVVGFADVRVYNDGDMPAETLLDYIKETNREIARKRAEFGLDEETDK